MAVDICIWDKCNNRCLMCTNPDAPWPAHPDGGTDYDYTSVIDRIEARKKEIESADSIYIAGGEPTIHPRFLDIWSYLEHNFPRQRIVLLSNGRRFFYEDFAKKTLAIKNNLDVDLSLHGSTAEVHESLTGAPGSFEQAKEGLKNLLLHKRPRHFVGVRYVITQKSYPYLADFLKLACREFPFIDRIIFVFWEVENQALKNCEQLHIDYTQVFPYLEQCVPLIKELKEVRFYHFPLCTVPVELWPHVWRTLPQEEVEYCQVCNECKYKDLCLGIPDTYYNYRGEEELIASKEISPIKKEIPMEINKSNYYHHPITRTFI